MAARRYELSDAQWEQIKDMIPRAKTGRPPKDDRLMLNAMLWLARSGAAWADIPERYGPHQSVYSRFCKWRDDGTLLRIFQALNADASLTMKTFVSTALQLILSRLVDTFISRISLTMLPVPNPHNTVCVLSGEEARHWQSRSSGYSSS